MLSQRAYIPSVVSDLRMLPVDPINYAYEDEEINQRAETRESLRLLYASLHPAFGHVPQTKTLAQFLIEVDTDGLPYDLYDDFIVPNREARAYER